MGRGGPQPAFQVRPEHSYPDDTIRLEETPNIEIWNSSAGGGDVTNDSQDKRNTSDANKTHSDNESEKDEDEQNDELEMEEAGSPERNDIFYLEHSNGKGEYLVTDHNNCAGERNPANKQDDLPSKRSSSFQADGRTRAVRFSSEVCSTSESDGEHVKHVNRKSSMAEGSSTDGNARQGTLEIEYKCKFPSGYVRNKNVPSETFFSDDMEIEQFDFNEDSDDDDDYYIRDEDKEAPTMDVLHFQDFITENGQSFGHYRILDEHHNDSSERTEDEALNQSLENLPGPADEVDRTTAPDLVSSFIFDISPRILDDTPIRRTHDRLTSFIEKDEEGSRQHNMGSFDSALAESRFVCGDLKTHDSPQIRGNCMLPRAGAKKEMYNQRYICPLPSQESEVDIGNTEHDPISKESDELCKTSSMVYVMSQSVQCSSSEFEGLGGERAISTMDFERERIQRLLESLESNHVEYDILNDENNVDSQVSSKRRSRRTASFHNRCSNIGETPPQSYSRANGNMKAEMDSGGDLPVFNTRIEYGGDVGRFLYFDDEIRKTFDANMTLPVDSKKDMFPKMEFRRRKVMELDSTITDDEAVKESSSEHSDTTQNLSDAFNVSFCESNLSTSLLKKEAICELRGDKCGLVGSELINGRLNEAAPKVTSKLQNHHHDGVKHEDNMGKVMETEEIVNVDPLDVTGELEVIAYTDLVMRQWSSSVMDETEVVLTPNSAARTDPDAPLMTSEGNESLSDIVLTGKAVNMKRTFGSAKRAAMEDRRLSTIMEKEQACETSIPASEEDAGFTDSKADTANKEGNFANFISESLQLSSRLWDDDIPQKESSHSFEESRCVKAKEASEESSRDLKHQNKDQATSNAEVMFAATKSPLLSLKIEDFASKEELMNRANDGSAEVWHPKSEGQTSSAGKVTMVSCSAQVGSTFDDVDEVTVAEPYSALPGTVVTMMSRDIQVDIVDSLSNEAATPFSNRIESSMGDSGSGEIVTMMSQSIQVGTELAKSVYRADDYQGDADFSATSEDVTSIAGSATMGTIDKRANGEVLIMSQKVQEMAVSVQASMDHQPGEDTATHTESSLQCVEVISHSTQIRPESEGNNFIMIPIEVQVEPDKKRVAEKVELMSQNDQPGTGNTPLCPQTGTVSHNIQESTDNALENLWVEMMSRSVQANIDDTLMGPDIETISHSVQEETENTLHSLSGKMISYNIQANIDDTLMGPDVEIISHSVQAETENSLHGLNEKMISYNIQAKRNETLLGPDVKIISHCVQAETENTVHGLNGKIISYNIQAKTDDTQMRPDVETISHSVQAETEYTVHSLNGKMIPYNIQAKTDDTQMGPDVETISHSVQAETENTVHSLNGKMIPYNIQAKTDDTQMGPDVETISHSVQAETENTVHSLNGKMIPYNIQAKTNDTLMGSLVELVSHSVQALRNDTSDNFEIVAHSVQENTYEDVTKILTDSSSQDIMMMSRSVQIGTEADSSNTSIGDEMASDIQVAPTHESTFTDSRTKLQLMRTGKHRSSSVLSEDTSETSATRAAFVRGGSLRSLGPISSDTDTAGASLAYSEPIRKKKRQKDRHLDYRLPHHIQEELSPASKTSAVDIALDSDNFQSVYASKGLESYVRGEASSERIDRKRPAYNNQSYASRVLAGDEQEKQNGPESRDGTMCGSNLNLQTSRSARSSINMVSMVSESEQVDLDITRDTKSGTLFESRDGSQQQYRQSIAGTSLARIAHSVNDGATSIKENFTSELQEAPESREGVRSGSNLNLHTSRGTHLTLSMVSMISVSEQVELDITPDRESALSENRDGSQQPSKMSISEKKPLTTGSVRISNSAINAAKFRRSEVQEALVELEEESQENRKMKSNQVKEKRMLLKEEAESVLSDLLSGVDGLPESLPMTNKTQGVTEMSLKQGMEKYISQDNDQVDKDLTALQTDRAIADVMPEEENLKAAPLNNCQIKNNEKDIYTQLGKQSVPEMALKQGMEKYISQGNDQVDEDLTALQIDRAISDVMAEEGNLKPAPLQNRQIMDNKKDIYTHLGKTEEVREATYVSEDATGPKGKSSSAAGLAAAEEDASELYPLTTPLTSVNATGDNSRELGTLTKSLRAVSLSEHDLLAMHIPKIRKLPSVREKKEATQKKISDRLYKTTPLPPVGFKAVPPDESVGSEPSAVPRVRENITGSPTDNEEHLPESRTERDERTAQSHLDSSRAVNASHEHESTVQFLNQASVGRVEIGLMKKDGLRFSNKDTPKEKVNAVQDSYHLKTSRFDKSQEPPHPLDDQTHRMRTRHPGKTSSLFYPKNLVAVPVDQKWMKKVLPPLVPNPEKVQAQQALIIQKITPKKLNASPMEHKAKNNQPAIGATRDKPMGKKKTARKAKADSENAVEAEGDEKNDAKEKSKDENDEKKPDDDVKKGDEENNDNDDEGDEEGIDNSGSSSGTETRAGGDKNRRQPSGTGGEGGKGPKRETDRKCKPIARTTLFPPKVQCDGVYDPLEKVISVTVKPIHCNMRDNVELKVQVQRKRYNLIQKMPRSSPHLFSSVPPSPKQKSKRHLTHRRKKSSNALPSYLLASNILELRAANPPFNTHLNEEASRRHQTVYSSWRVL